MQAANLLASAQDPSEGLARSAVARVEADRLAVSSLVAYQPFSSCRAITMRWIWLVPSQIWGS